MKINPLLDDALSSALTGPRWRLGLLEKYLRPPSQPSILAENIEFVVSRFFC